MNKDNGYQPESKKHGQECFSEDSVMYDLDIKKQHCI
jgi:hypothetical protein